MTRRLRLPSLSSLTRAYQRNLKTLTRALKPVRAKAVKVTKKSAKKTTAVVKSASGVKPVKTAKPATKAARSKVAPVEGDWIAGVALGLGGARRFHLHVPPGLALQPGEKLPLMVMLHGCGQTGLDFAKSTRMGRLAARKRFLVLYPEQERMANAQGCWNWFHQRNGQADAEATILWAAVNQVAQRYPVDLARVAVAGLSAGASMAALMALRFPERFRAVIMHSGVVPGAAESTATVLGAMMGQRTGHLPSPYAGIADPAALITPLPPLLVLHGNVDGVVSVRNGIATAQLWAQSQGAKAGVPTTQQRGKRYSMRVTEFKANGRPVAVLREISGLGHAWSGGAAKLPYSDSAGPDASALAWAFAEREFKRVVGK
ncbi:extracellular catalytic domain type 1 short-chain-length polyhydroxyalkanoate depolymerase [Simplicispira psychrophila]|uniref:extracellular catalytic domain type 1 short-chain-length polyhydroxyalkanoate depolymerase n=1 Tax=Simplicispira psychrophila TaxID=80882 RepID=UPI0004833F77|nr:PHB depolymerase family esterase [Simplicispira psychrophila]